MTQVTNWKEKLSDATLDPKVGIKIAKLTQDQEFSMHVTEIAPGSKVGSHFHQDGVEVYQILSGKGHMYLAEADRQSEIQKLDVSGGDFFTIKPNVVHQLENSGSDPLVLIFGCPQSHLSADRVICQDLC